jgi:hypothetical protein
VESEDDEEPQISSPMPVFRKPLWILGLVTLITGTCIQLACLPFADMTLIATNCVFAIFFTQMLNIMFLGERYKWKHDLPSMLFLTAGTVLLIMASNTEAVHLEPS